MLEIAGGIILGVAGLVVLYYVVAGGLVAAVRFGQWMGETVDFRVGHHSLYLPKGLIFIGTCALVLMMLIVAYDDRPHPTPKKPPMDCAAAEAEMQKYGGHADCSTK